MAKVMAEIDLSSLSRRLEGVVRAHVDEVKRGVVRDLRKAEYQRDDAKRNEQRANGRLEQMREAVAERDAEIEALRNSLSGLSAAVIDDFHPTVSRGRMTVGELKRAASLLGNMS